jgi:hypothetical protein
MATERGAEPTDVATQVQRLASLWRAVTSLPMHPAGCTCMGHFLIPALNARDMEADILDYMRGRYAADRLDALVALLDAREAEREADTPLVPFRTWLLRLPESGLAVATLERFVTDLTDTLESFGGDSRPSGSGSGIICT